MTANTIYNHFASVLAEYGLPSSITVDFSSHYVSEKLRSNCEKSGIGFPFSLPYHHQTNSLAERTI